MRYLYSFLFYLALPFVFLRLFWRSKAYRKRLPERLGFYPVRFEHCLWVHAVSVGEVIAAVPLIKALQAKYPKLPMVVTTMTPTGAARVQAAFADSVTHVYIPYDLPDAVARFLSSMNPVAGIIIETELWPNLIAACYQRSIPVCLVNARLSEQSAAGYRRIASLTRDMLQRLTIIAAHGQSDAARFLALGAPKERMQVTGNIKFDLSVSPELADKATALRAQLGKDRFIWIAASTHEGEEELVLAAHQQLRQQNPNALLILVPRHPDRFDAIAKLAAQSFAIARRSLQEACTPETAVYLGDTMGELLLLYGAADVAFVGGSLIPRGGHNMLEPAALGKPILTGPHLFNFAEISELVIAAGAMIKVATKDELTMQLIKLMQDSVMRADMGKKALRVMADNRGALASQLAMIEGVVG